MKPFGRLRERLVPAILAGALLIMVGLAVPSTAEEPKTTALETYGGCLVAQHKGDLLVLFDESGSLKKSDPKAARVAAAKYLLTQLEGFATRTKVALDVSIAGFATDYSATQDWTRLDAKGLPVLTGAIDEYAGRNNGFETDYWTALEGARRSLAERGGGDRCQAVLWFSDGELAIDWRHNPDEEEKYGTTKPYLDQELTSKAAATAATKAARAGLCRDGGLADQLRSSKVTMLGIGLTGGEAKKSDFDDMKAIVEGSAGKTSCGKLIKPKPGKFTLVGNIDDLLFAFDELQDPGRRPVQQKSGVCQGEVCAEQAHRFVLDNSLKGVHILGSADVGKLDVYLVPPTGSPVKLERTDIGKATSDTTGGVKINYAWQSARTIAVDLTRADKATAWSGLWSMVFVDPKSDSPDATSRTNIHISGDIFPAWPDAAKAGLRSTEVAKDLKLGLADSEGKAIDPKSLLGSMRLDATFIAPDGTESVLAQGLTAKSMIKSQQLDLTKVAPGKGSVRLSLSVTTAGTKDASGKKIPGTTLSPQVVTVPVTIAPPPGYPTLGGEVNFGSFEGPVDTTAKLAVTGPGCVWLDRAPEIVTSPDSIGMPTITSGSDTAGNCVEAAEGEQRDLELTLRTSEAGNGSLNGFIDVQIAPPDEPDRASTVRVPFTADLRKPLDQPRFWLTLLAALILGPGIPIGLLYLAKRVTARIPGRALLATEIPVTVTGDQVLRAGGVFALQDQELKDLVRLRQQGSTSAVAGSTELKTRTGASPFGAGFVSVESPGRVGASSAHALPLAKTGFARLPLAVHNHWVVLHDPAGPAQDATVLMLVSGDASPQSRQDLVDDLNRRLPEVFAGLRSSGAGPTPANGFAAPVAPDPFVATDPGGAAVDAPFDFPEEWSAPPASSTTVQSPPAPNVPTQPAADTPDTSDQQPGSQQTQPPPADANPSTGSGNGASTGSGNGAGAEDDWNFDFSFDDDDKDHRGGQ